MFQNISQQCERTGKENMEKEKMKEIIAYAVQGLIQDFQINGWMSVVAILNFEHCSNPNVHLTVLIESLI